MSVLVKLVILVVGWLTVNTPVTNDGGWTLMWLDSFLYIHWCRTTSDPLMDLVVCCFLDYPPNLHYCTVYYCIFLFTCKLKIFCFSTVGDIKQAMRIYQLRLRETRAVLFECKVCSTCMYLYQWRNKSKHPYKRYIYKHVCIPTLLYWSQLLLVISIFI